MINKVEANPKEMLELHKVSVEVVAWRVNDGEHTPCTYQMKIGNELYEKNSPPYPENWRKWHKKKGTGNYATGYSGHWRLAGVKQQLFLAMLFTCAHRCRAIINKQESTGGTEKEISEHDK